MRLTERELATVLHGLRVIQEGAGWHGPQGRREHSCLQRGAECDHFTGTSILDEDEIDALCERLNERAPAARICGDTYHIGFDHHDNVMCREPEGHTGQHKAPLAGGGYQVWGGNRPGYDTLR